MLEWADDLPCCDCGHVHPARQSCEEAVREERMQSAVDRQEERDRNES